MRKTYESLKKALLEPEAIFEPTMEEAAAWYNLFNRMIFGNVLPKVGSENFTFTIRPMKNAWGECGYFTVALRDPFLELTTRFRTKRLFLEVLAHEMIHLHQVVSGLEPDHSKKTFWVWRPELNKYHLGLRIKYSKSGTT